MRLRDSLRSTVSFLGEKAFRPEAMGQCLEGKVLASLGIADFRSQICNLKFAICNPEGFEVL